MKYCPKCGSEHTDEAVYCAKCGVMLNSYQPNHNKEFKNVNPTKVEEKPVNSEQSKPHIFFEFIYNALAVSTACFLALSVAFSWIYINSGANNVVRAYWFPNSELAGIAFVLAIAATVCSLICLRFSLKMDNKFKYVLSSLTRMLFAIGIGIVSFVFSFS